MSTRCFTVMVRSCAVMLLLAMAGTLPAAMDPDPCMGDWQGKQTLADGKKVPMAAEVIALGDGKFDANLIPSFEKRWPVPVVLHGALAGTEVVFTGEGPASDGTPAKWTGKIAGEAFTGEAVTAAGKENFQLKKMVRKSPTLGKRAPKGAVVLFDGKNLDQWQAQGGGKPAAWEIKDGAMEVTRGVGSIISKKQFGDCKVHLEFRTPYMPKDRGQGRGNSGVYLQGRYEVQVLDSYGLEGLDNECGGIYTVSKPKRNMCFPPTVWQTYDIEFLAPKFNEKGEKTEKARITVRHNGELIQENTEVPDPTAASMGGDVKQPEGLYLQDHGNPVQYRNIWVEEIR